MVDKMEGAAGEVVEKSGAFQNEVVVKSPLPRFAS